MCATEHSEVEQESFWSRLPVFRSRAEFKLGPLTPPETAKKAQSESLRSRPARRVAAGMHRFAKIPAAHRAQRLPRGRVLSKKGRSASGAEFRTAFKTVLQRTVRGRSEDGQRTPHLQRRPHVLRESGRFREGRGWTEVVRKSFARFRFQARIQASSAPDVCSGSDATPEVVWKSPCL